MIFNPNLLTGKTAIVTGAAGDIGLAIAVHLYEVGASVALLDLDEALLRKRVPQAMADGTRSMLMACDVSDPAQTAQCVDVVAGRFGAVDVLVNNAAALTPTQDVADLPLQDWNQAFSVNVTGAFLMTARAIPHMRSAGGGVVLNIASQMGHVTARGRAAYSASKAALLSLTRSIAVDHASDNIRAVSISPGAVLTSRLVRRYGSAEQATATLAPLYLVNRLGMADEVARTAVFVVGGMVEFITGTDLLIDGGYTTV
jgi:NAD(P)-dependent dehydrogenase (short-subunit alcohol dehydrogenase family)